MIRAIFTALGVLFAALLVFSASFIGNLAMEGSARGAEHERLAIDITRELARSWRLEDIAQHYADGVPRQVAAAPRQQASLAALRSLGDLHYADELARTTPWTQAAIDSPAAAAETLAALLRKSVTVTFIGRFANGTARVSVELRGQGGAMRLWNLSIEAGFPPSERPAAPQPIGLA